MRSFQLSNMFLTASVKPPWIPSGIQGRCSLRVKFDDQTLVDRHRQLFACGKALDLAGEGDRIELEPVGNPTSLGNFDRFLEDVLLAALLAHDDRVAHLREEARDVDALAVDDEMPV